MPFDRIAFKNDIGEVCAAHNLRFAVVLYPDVNTDEIVVGGWSMLQSEKYLPAAMQDEINKVMPSMLARLKEIEESKN